MILAAIKAKDRPGEEPSQANVVRLVGKQCWQKLGTPANDVPPMLKEFEMGVIMALYNFTLEVAS